VVLKLQPTPWSNPGGSLCTDNHTVTKERESWEDRALRSKFSHLFLTRMDDIDVVRKMATGIFGEFKEVETISNDPEGRCKRLQAHIRSIGAPFYSKIQVIKIHISLKFKNSLVQVDGPGRHYCHIAGRNHRRSIITFQVKRQGQVLLQHCFHPQCAGRHHNMGAIQHYDIRVLFAPGEMLKAAENKAPAEAIALAKNLQKTSLAHSTAVQKRTRRKTTVEHLPSASIDAAHSTDDTFIDQLPSKFGPNAPPPIPLLRPNQTASTPSTHKPPTLPPPLPTTPIPANAIHIDTAKSTNEHDDDKGEDEIEPPESPYDFDNFEEGEDDTEEKDEKEEKTKLAFTTIHQKPIKMSLDDALIPPTPPTLPTLPTLPSTEPTLTPNLTSPPASPSQAVVVLLPEVEAAIVVDENPKKKDRKRSEVTEDVGRKKKKKSLDTPATKKPRRVKPLNPPPTNTTMPVFEMTEHGLPLPVVSPSTAVALTSADLQAAATLQSIAPTTAPTTA
jgi:hypothetical protein